MNSFFSVRCSVKQAQKPRLRICFIFSWPDTAKGLVELVKQDDSLLVDGLDIGSDTPDELVNNNDRIPGLNRL